MSILHPQSISSYPVVNHSDDKVFFTSLLFSIEPLIPAAIELSFSVFLYRFDATTDTAFIGDDTSADVNDFALPAIAAIVPRRDSFS